MKPAPPGSSLRIVRPDEAAELARSMRLYYDFEEFAFDDAKVQRTLAEFLSHPEFGSAWFIEADGVTAGYAILCIGYSLEFGGRYAYLDELFLHEPYRGRGIGRSALREVIAEARRLGIRSLHLEVDPGNAAARRLYRCHGFEPREGFMLMSLDI